MSLKAKLEAVVYAAEEPVTMAQLAAIFAEEVLPGMGEAGSLQPAVEQVALTGLGLEPEAESDVNGTPAEEPGGLETAEPLGGEVDHKSVRARDRRVRQLLQGVLDELIADYANSERGMEIREIAGGYRMATKPEYHDAVRGFVKSLKPPMKLSLQALETLAVIAYKQPVTAPEVSEIRGVDSSGVLGGLVSRKLITTAGRKPVIGRPILYKTTKEFLLRFGLKDVNDLPSMEEFEKMAGELAESEAEGEAQDAIMRSSDALFSEHGSAQEKAQEIDADIEPEVAHEVAHEAVDGKQAETVTEPQEIASPGVTSEPAAVSES